MCKCLHYLEIITRICSLINKQQTGNPKELSEKLGISKRTTHRMLESLKDLGAPITWCKRKNSYICDENFSIEYKFQLKVLGEQEEKSILGGFSPFFIKKDEKICSTAKNGSGEY